MNCVRVSLLGVLLLPAAVMADPEPPFASLLPANTIAYIETNAPTAAEMARSVQFRCLQDPGLSRLLDRMLAEKSNFTQTAIPVGDGVLRATMGVRDPGLSFALRFAQGADVYSMKVRGNVAFAWVGMDSTRPRNARREMGGRQERRRRGPRTQVRPDIVAAFTIDGDPAEAYHLVSAVLQAMEPRRSGQVHPVVVGWKHKGVVCATGRVNETLVHFGVVGQRLVLASSRTRIIDIIDRSAKTTHDASLAAASLATVQRHVDARRSVVGTDGTITTLIDLDLRLALKSLATANPRQFGAVAGMAQAVGLGGLQGISSVTRVREDGIAGTTSVLFSGPRIGVSRLFAEKPPAKFGILAFAPKETLYVGCGRYDGRELFTALAEAVQPILMEALMEVHRDTGMNLRDDLFHLVGPEIGVIVSTNRGPIPDVGLIVESPDPKRLQASILKLLWTSNLRHVATLERARIAGGDVSVLRFKDSDVPIAPTFGVVDGHLVLALFPISYQRFAATKRGERAGLKENRDYASLAKHIPKDAIGMSYLDVRRTIGIVYDTVVPLVQAASGAPGQPATPVYELPEASVFTDHLYGNIGWRTADKRGMHWHSISSTDVGSIGLVVGAVAAGVVFVGLDAPEPRGTVQVIRVDPHADKEVRDAYSCVTNVRRIRNQLRAYKKREQPFPKTLEELRGGWVDDETLIVPGTDNLSYSYFGPDGKNGVLVAGRPNGPEGLICVLMTDMKMSRISPERLRTILSRQKRSGQKK